MQPNANSDQTTSNALPTLRIDARWLLPMDETSSILENHSVYVTEGKISRICPTADTQDKDVEEILLLPEHALLPGYVNAHGHAAMALFRGLADDLPLMTWLNDHIWPAEGQWVSEEFVYQGTQLAIAEMFKCGTTTFADNYFFSDHSTQAAVDAGMRVAIFTPILDFPTNYASNADEYIDKALAVHDLFKGEPLAHIGLGPHAPYTVSDAPLQRITQEASARGLSVQIHLHETDVEVAESLDKFGKRPTKRLFDLGFLNDKVSTVHMTQINDEDIDILQQSGAHVVHCPESNLKLASGFCPVQKLIDAGVNVGIGTDGAASNNDLNMQGEVKTAAMLAKAVAQDAQALPAMAALKAATIGSANALGLGQQTGSIEAGKWADLQAVKLSGLEQSPMYDPASQLVYTDSSRYTEYTWVAGKAVLAEGKLTSIDEAALMTQTQTWQKKITEGAN